MASKSTSISSKPINIRIDDLFLDLEKLKNVVQDLSKRNVDEESTLKTAEIKTLFEHVEKALQSLKLDISSFYFQMNKSLKEIIKELSSKNIRSKSIRSDVEKRLIKDKTDLPVETEIDKLACEILTSMQLMMRYVTFLEQTRDSLSENNLGLTKAVMDLRKQLSDVNKELCGAKIQIQDLKTQLTKDISKTEESAKNF